MTKLIFNSILGLIVVFPPAVSLAASFPLQNAFCVRTPAFSSRVRERIAARENQSLAKEAERLEMILARRAGQDADRAALHARQDSDRNALFASLRSRARTPAAEGAAERFYEAVQEAYRVRRATVSEAAETYRSEVDRLLASRSDILREAFRDLRETSLYAFQDAEAACANGSSGTEIRALLRSGLEGALTRFRAFRVKLSLLTSAHRSAKTERDADLKESVEAFSAAVLRARDDLKGTF